MMTNPLIEKTIKINASPAKVWEVFTNPVLTREMGGEYMSEWKSGSPLAWKAQDGTMQSNGIILEVESGRLLRHDLYDHEDENRLLSVITYEFTEDNGGTILSAREELKNDLTEERFAEVSEGWDLALQAVKGIAETHN